MSGWFRWRGSGDGVAVDADVVERVEGAGEGRERMKPPPGIVEVILRCSS